MRSILSITLSVSVTFSAFVPAYAGGNPQRQINNAVNSVMNAHENRNNACWNRSASACRSASARVAENCQNYLYIREDVQSANVFWPDSTRQADRICRDPFGSGGFPTETVRRHDNVRPRFVEPRGSDAGEAMVWGAIGFAAGALAGKVLTEPQPAEPYYDGPPPDLQWNVSPFEGDTMGLDYFPPAPKK